MRRPPLARCRRLDGRSRRLGALIERLRAGRAVPTGRALVLSGEGSRCWRYTDGWETDGPGVIDGLPEPRQSQMQHLHDVILDALPGDRRARDRLFGPLIGYGWYAYSNSKGPAGEWFSVGLANRKAYISLYAMGKRDGRYLVEAMRDQFPGTSRAGAASTSSSRRPSTTTRSGSWHRLVEQLRGWVPSGHAPPGMTDTLRVILEIGKKAPGRCGCDGLARPRSLGDSEDDALDKLSSYLPRYAGVAERAGMGSAFARARESRWSNASRDRARPTSGASPTCRRRSSARCCRRPTWNGGSISCAPAGPTSTTSRHASPPSSAPGLAAVGAVRDQIIRHVYVNEPEQFSRKVEVRTPLDVVLTPDGLATHRRAYLDAIRAYNAEGRPARTWPIQFLVRRTAHHVMDHAWELEDRDLTA